MRRDARPGECVDGFSGPVLCDRPRPICLTYLVLSCINPIFLTLISERVPEEKKTTHRHLVGDVSMCIAGITVSL